MYMHSVCTKGLLCRVVLCYVMIVIFVTQDDQRQSITILLCA